MGRAAARARLFLVCLALAPALPAGVAAQSITSGALRGEIRGLDGTPIPGALVTLEGPGAGAVRALELDFVGRFSVSLLAPGTYAVLAEEAGYQPVRQGGIVVRAGEVASVTIELERRPPPVDAIEDRPDLPTAQLPAFPGIGRGLDQTQVRWLDWRQDLGDLGRGLTTVTGPPGGRTGLALAADALPQAYSRFLVDGLPQTALRHPGAPAEGAGLPAFPRTSLGQALVLNDAFDAEWGGAAGVLVSAQSRSGGGRFGISPYLTFSSSALGASGEDNPGDSSATSVQGGVVLRGSIVRDTAQFLLGFNYEALEFPGSDPWAGDSAEFGGAQVSLREALPLIAADTFSAAVDSYARPVVRDFKGGNAFGRLDWRLGERNALSVRASLARWKEQNPLLGEDLVSGLGSRLEGRDFSVGFSLASSFTRVANEFRAGLRVSRREWLEDGLPTTLLVGEGAALGASPLYPADFDERAVDLTNTIHYLSGNHRVKVGGGVSFTRWKQDYLYGSEGIYQFGDLDRFGNAEGTFFQAAAPSTEVDFSSQVVSLFLGDVWTPSAGVQLIGGVRWEAQFLPQDAITRDTAWISASGIAAHIRPADRNNFAPRAGFVWDIGDRHQWILRGGGGLFYTGMPASTFSELALYDGDRGVLVSRGLGTFAGWPDLPDSADAPVVGSRLAILSAEDRNPRTGKMDLSLAAALPGQLSLEVRGGYYHTDFLMRRSDLNLPGSPTGTTQEGRAVYGTLVQQGGLVTPMPGSNRRFGNFDLVSGLAPTGYVDHYAVTLTLERRVRQGLGFTASYTWSRTEDNVPLGPAGDPADQLTPFVELTGSDDWLDGRSDLDIPHRFALLGEYRFPGRLAVAVGARYRYRSGLPFTPGFRDGVDLNGDGSGRNDPAYLDTGLAGLDDLIGDHDCLAGQEDAFVERNSCRADGVHALDLRLSLTLPVRAFGGGLQLVVDAFNVVSSATGLVDRAVVLVDPAQALTIDPAGNVTVPFVANPRFGTLLSRRTEPRLVRLGLKVDY